MTLDAPPRTPPVPPVPPASPAVAEPELGQLRAALLGATDGVVSVAGIVVGVAGATAASAPVLAAGAAGLVAGAVSMALGEYVSVSAQRDGQLAARRSRPAARVLLGAGPGPLEGLARPVQAAGASAAAFVTGGLLPLLAAALAPRGDRLLVVAVAVLAALALAGTASARSTGARVGRSVLRVLVGGSLGLVVTHVAGVLVGAAIS